MNKTQKVTDYINRLNNPLKDEINAVREIILGVSDNMVEDIKWGAPSFAYKDNMATFNPRAKKFVNLTFHKGAIINDTTGLLIGDKKEARVARFDNIEDVMAKKTALETVVKQWIAVMDSV